MQSNTSFSALNYKYILVTIFGVLFSFIFHELAHWAMGEALGYKMGMTVNTAYPLIGTMPEAKDQIVSITGPLFTLVQAIVAYFLLIK